MNWKSVWKSKKMPDIWGKPRQLNHIEESPRQKIAVWVLRGGLRYRALRYTYIYKHTHNIYIYIYIYNMCIYIYIYNILPQEGRENVRAAFLQLSRGATSSDLHSALGFHSFWTLLHFGLQSSRLNVCWYHQDLPYELFHPGFRQELRRKVSENYGKQTSDGFIVPPSFPQFRERGSAPKRGRHSTIWFSTKCICALAAWWSDNPRRKVAPRSWIPRNTSYEILYYSTVCSTGYTVTYYNIL